MKSLLGAPIIALIIVYIDNTIMELSIYWMVVSAAVISILLHEILPKGIRSIREQNDV